MSVTTLLVLLAVLLLAAKCAGWICQRIGIPTVLGQLLVGVLAGPSVLNWIHPDPLLNSFSTIGVILLMFIAGKGQVHGSGVRQKILFSLLELGLDLFELSAQRLLRQLRNFDSGIAVLVDILLGPRIGECRSQMAVRGVASQLQYVRRIHQADLQGSCDVVDRVFQIRLPQTL